jgi:prepilin-type N-terminal cleavage/methylation domain-containing protein
LVKLANQNTDCKCIRHVIFKAGFTLVELLIVIALISILALGAATMLVDDGERGLIQRSEETQSRWNAIRTAILGDSSSNLAGAPHLSGYVADMGRLPQNIKELMVQEADATNPQQEWVNIMLYKKFTAANCTTNIDDCYWLAGGWRGPYLYTAGSAEYRDSWNNVDADANVDAFNFGWQVSVSGVLPNHTGLLLQSLGLDNQAGGVDYKQDFPLDAAMPMVSESDWLNTESNLQFNIRLNKPITADINGLYLRVYYFQDDAEDSTLPDLSFQTSAQFNMLNTDRTASVPITLNSQLPMGRYAVVIYCSDPDTAPDLEVFDDVSGTCDSTNDSPPYYFQLLPNSTIINVLWNLP